jgi:hypothetical protein
MVHKPKASDIVFSAIQIKHQRTQRVVMMLPFWKQVSETQEDRDKDSGNTFEASEQKDLLHVSHRLPIRWWHLLSGPRKEFLVFPPSMSSNLHIASQKSNSVFIIEAFQGDLFFTHKHSMAASASVLEA